MPQGDPERDEQRDDDRKADEQTTHGTSPSFSEAVQVLCADTTAFYARAGLGWRFPIASQFEKDGKQSGAKCDVSY
jgi:hypothetical protein